MTIIAPLAIFAAAASTVITAPPPPPPVIVAHPGRAEAQTTSLIAVEVRQGRTMLWQGDLSLASSGYASFSQRKQDSFACEASRQSGRTAAQLNTNLTVNLGRGYSRDELVPVTVEWTRPMTDQHTSSPACDGEEIGTLTARIQTRVELAKGKAVTLNGDGSLNITLTRR